MEKFRITLNGQSYEVEVERISNAGCAPAHSPCGGSKISSACISACLQCRLPQFRPLQHLRRQQEQRFWRHRCLARS